MNRILGKNGPLVSAVGLGCMGMSGAYGESDDKLSVATIERALELGHNFLDTADFYGMGHNEELIAKAIKGKRDKAFISLKTGQLRSPGGFGPVNAHPDYLRNAVLFSLQRLKTDYIDLYTPARVDPEVPVEETVGALADLVQKGVIRYIGLSEAAAGTIRRAMTVHPITAVQLEYSLWTREIEAEVLPLLRESGIGLVAYSPLSRGFLSGTLKTPEEVTDNRVHMPRFREEHFYRNLELVEKVKALAAEKDCSPAQLAIAWVLAQGDNIIAIPGTKRIPYLEENIASEKVILSPEDLHRITADIPPGAVSGTRYPEMFLKHLNQ